MRLVQLQRLAGVEVGVQCQLVDPLGHGVRARPGGGRSGEIDLVAETCGVCALQFQAGVRRRPHGAGALQLVGRERGVQHFGGGIALSARAVHVGGRGQQLLVLGAVLGRNRLLNQRGIVLHCRQVRHAGVEVLHHPPALHVLGRQLHGCRRGAADELLQARITHGAHASGQRLVVQVRQVHAGFTLLCFRQSGNRGLQRGALLLRGWCGWLGRQSQVSGKGCRFGQRARIGVDGGCSRGRRHLRRSSIPGTFGLNQGFRCERSVEIPCGCSACLLRSGSILSHRQHMAVLLLLFWFQAALDVLGIGGNVLSIEAVGVDLCPLHWGTFCRSPTGKQRHATTGCAAQGSTHTGRRRHALHRVDGRVVGHRSALALVLGHALLHGFLRTLHRAGLQRTGDGIAREALGPGDQALCAHHPADTTDNGRDHAGLAPCGHCLLIRGAALGGKLVGRARSIATGHSSTSSSTTSQAAARSVQARDGRQRAPALHGRARAHERADRLGSSQARVVHHVAAHGAQLVHDAIGIGHALAEALLLGLDRIALAVLASLHDVLVDPARNSVARADEVGRRRHAASRSVRNLDHRVIGDGGERAPLVGRTEERVNLAGLASGCLGGGRAVEEVVDLAHPPSLPATAGGRKPYWGVRKTVGSVQRQLVAVCVGGAHRSIQLHLNLQHQPGILQRGQVVDGDERGGAGQLPRVARAQREARREGGGPALHIPLALSVVARQAHAVLNHLGRRLELLARAQGVAGQGHGQERAILAGGPRCRGTHSKAIILRGKGHGLVGPGGNAGDQDGGCQGVAHEVSRLGR